MNFILFIVFIIQASLGIILGTFFENSLSTYLQVYLTQLIPIFIPTLICCLISEKGFNGFSGSKKPTVLNAILCIIMAICLNIILSFASTYIGASLFPKFYSQSSDSVLPSTVFEFVLEIIFVCIMPALFEEGLFRGVVLTSYEKIYGSKKAIVMCGLAFALMHNSLTSFLPQFLIGIFLSFIVMKFGSIYLGMIAHFTNNFTTLFIQYVVLQKWSSSKTLLFRNPILTVIVLLLIFTISMFAALRLNRDVTFKQRSLPWKIRKREKKFFKLIVLLFIIIQIVLYVFL